ncbi:MgtC/SapB family protein [Porphyromonas sp.]|uniref:MgtC/SapB family protein n=1 Tax=Porphyromonas sp. TaxID=1924944 RepID=UPI0026DC65A9|nr:MgtC/SapB family protein [Porphyromonas sp.]MDO4695330.1 MgtC/SapB family protein [Porphyromonas sp.]MDO4771090.1 MgtC/SapB family protein [Porphyromonas sp.]
MSFDTLNSLFPFLYHQGIEVQDIPIRLFYSAILGVVIGYNRQIRYHNAGLRTFALITVGSCIAMLCSIYIPYTFGMGDFTRIAAQVVSGVGFLGAGAIIRGRGNHIQGMTTAALIWVSAVLGLAVGAGMYITGLLITFIVLLILITLENLKSRLEINLSEVTLTLLFRERIHDCSDIKENILAHGIRMQNYSIEVDNDKNMSTYVFQLRCNSDEDITKLHKVLSAREDIQLIKIER